MRNVRLVIALVCLSLASAALVQAQEESKASYSVSLNQDIFFGTYATMNGAYKAKEKLDWTYYGIFWNTPSFGTGGGGGLWTEFGSGVRFTAADGKLSFNPQLGFLSGRLLSNGQFPMAFEGLVPNIVANLNTSKAEGEFYMGYYAAIRKGQAQNQAGTGLTSVPTQNNFLHWWGNAGYKVSRTISFGLHYEALYFNPTGSVRPASADLYRWLGPYFQAALSSQFTVRFTGGANILSRPPTDGNDSFYKLSAIYSF
ncbi:MAG: DUF6733 family protein [Bryobacteraceae bacterium]